MSFEILYTDNFARELKRLAKKYSAIKSDVEEVVTSLEQDATQGTPMSNNCFKIRMAISAKGKGKSAGARPIIHLCVTKRRIYLLSIYDKSGQENISDRQLKALLKSIV